MFAVTGIYQVLAACLMFVKQNEIQKLAVSGN